MGAVCSSTPTAMDPNAKANRAIDYELEQARISDSLHFKLLCLGAGESGKSTIVKQLMFIHSRHKLTDGEKRDFIPVLHSNALQVCSTWLCTFMSFSSMPVYFSLHSVCRFWSRRQRSSTSRLILSLIVVCFQLQFPSSPH